MTTRCTCEEHSDPVVVACDIHRDAGTVTEFYRCTRCDGQWNREYTFAEIERMNADEFAPVGEPAEFCETEEEPV